MSTSLSPFSAEVTTNSQKDRLDSSPAFASPLNNNSPFSAEASPIPNEKEQQYLSQQPQHVPMEFPSIPSVPPKKLLQSLYEQAMSIENSDQKELSRFGILSLEDVLLPAVSEMHNTALKGLQKQWLRDHPELVTAVVQARQALYQASAVARLAAMSARQYRQQHVPEVLRERKLAAQKQQAQHAAQVRSLQRLAQQREFKKKYPPNQEAWREVAYLMTELGKLEKEERVWKQAEQTLKDHLYDILVLDDDAMEVEDHDSDQHDNNADNKENLHTIAVVESVRDMQLACTRIDQTLEVVQTALQNSQELRREAAAVHDQGRFAGYGLSQQSGGTTAKDLIRFMSQEESI